MPTLGLIAGNGDLPERIIRHCMAVSQPVFVIAITDTPPPSLEHVPHARLRIGAVGKAISLLKEAGAQSLLFAGGLRRPSFSALRPDALGLLLLAKISQAKMIGDNALLSLVIRFFEDHGFNVTSVADVLPDLLMPKGILGTVKPSKPALKDIDTGIPLAHAIGDLDIGQGIIIQNGVVLGVEAIEGTDQLIRRCKPYQNDGKGGILIKVKKPTQDRRIDLPTIGLTTLENAIDSGLQGIAVEAGSTLLLDKHGMVQLANEKGLFVVGI